MWCFKGKKKKKPKKKGKLNQIEISNDLNKKRKVLKRIQKLFSNKHKNKAKGQSSPPEIMTEISQQSSQQASQHAESNLADNISEASETEVMLKEPLQEQIVTEISQQSSQQASQHAESNLADNISEASETEVMLKEPLQEQIVTEISQQSSQQASQHAESNLADNISEASETEVMLKEPLQEQIVTEISQQSSQQASQHAESNLADNISEASETEVMLKEPLQEQIVTEISQQSSQQASQHAESNLADNISEASETEVRLKEPLQEQETPQDFMNKGKPFSINIEAEIHEDSENSGETPKGAQVVEPLWRKRARQLVRPFMMVLSFIIPILAFVDTILIFLDSGPKTGTNKYNIIHGVFLIIYLVDFVLNLINNNQWKKDEMVVILLNTLDVVLALFKDRDFQQKFRAVRILRMVFILRFFPRMRFDLKVALQPESSVLYAFFLILYLFFIFVAFFYHYFHEIDHLRFGSRRRTIFTLSQVLVLDDWYDIFLDNNAKGAGHILILLASFIIIIHLIGFSLITAMMMHNYFVAYDAVKKAKVEEDDEETFSTESTDLESEEMQGPLKESILETKREIEMQMELESVYDQIVQNNEAFQIYSDVLQEILHFITYQPMTMKPDELEENDIGT